MTREEGKEIDNKIRNMISTLIISHQCLRVIDSNHNESSVAVELRGETVCSCVHIVRIHSLKHFSHVNQSVACICHKTIQVSLM